MVIRYKNALWPITGSKKVAIFPVKRKLLLKNIINTTGITVERLTYLINIRYTKGLHLIGREPL